ncbi:hypothetical protein RD792_009506 [Penstemon davidsonii]|uniref:Uncharacterized protein n=1 Tax=Penstemon davidsonii TaxID=160366 RepID=A0ABR0D0M3_9LAMI|nr:hypothetical protein RD792_009506 [Penstemon davidsonii]
MFLLAMNMTSSLHSFSLMSTSSGVNRNSFPRSVSCASFVTQGPAKGNYLVRRLMCCADSSKSHPSSDTNTNRNLKLNPKGKTQVPQNEGENSESQFPPIKPKKTRRGRRSEAAAVEDFVRDTLGRTFESIRKQNPEILKDIENIMKAKRDEDIGSEDSSDDDDSDDDVDEEEKEMLVEEEDPNWPLDADVGWGIRASEYFEQHSIKNVVGEDGHEIDWEGEIDEGLVKEINCLEWESFAFHPSPLIVLVFERYNRQIFVNFDWKKMCIILFSLAYSCLKLFTSLDEIQPLVVIGCRASDNWKVLKELEKATKVYWEAKDRLPPRTVKIDMNIERDLAYALKVKECPQILFLRGNKILYRETGMEKIALLLEEKDN